MFGMRKYTFAVFAAILLVASACTTFQPFQESEYGTGPIEKTLIIEIDKQGDFATPVLAITCPNKDTNQGATFTCNGTTQAGEAVAADVTITSDSGDMDWKLYGGDATGSGSANYKADTRR